MALKEWLAVLPAVEHLPDPATGATQIWGTSEYLRANKRANGFYVSGSFSFS
jgi:hypothetical protein